MKWQFLLVCVALGALLIGCESGSRQPTEQDAEPIPETPTAAIDKADGALAELEKAVQGSDIEAVRRAVVSMNTALNGLMSHLSDMDLKAKEEARQAGATEMPTGAADALKPALQALQDAHSAVLPPPKNDVAKVKEVIPVIKSGLDAVRDVAK